MALQFSLDKTGFDALDDTLKAMYKADGEGYKLAIDGLPQQEDTAGLKSKLDELLSEKKAEQEKAKAAKAEALKLAEEKARKDGDHEALLKSYEDKLAAKDKEHSDLLSTISAGKVEGEAMKIATALADGSNAELLSTFVKQRLRFDEGKVQVLNKDGQLVANTVSELQTEFASDDRYKSLLRGNQSAGGGAAGNQSGGAAQGEKIKRSEFEALEPAKQMAFVKGSDNEIVD